jgi:hypothetical protein
MITKEEGRRIEDLKRRVQAGENVSSADKQWVLSMTAREQVPVPKIIKQRAKNNGFDVRGIKTL